MEPGRSRVDASLPPARSVALARSPKRARTLVLVGILCTVALAGIDTTVVSTVMPVALVDLGGVSLYAWTFAAYMLATAITMPIWGPGSDRWGRRRTFIAGVAVFVIGSVLCALAPTMPLFIAARAVQGIGAGATTSLPFAILGVAFPPEKRGRALGIVSSAWAVSSVAGPLVGTAIVSAFSWRWVFLVNVPVGIAAVSLVLLGMQESVGHRAGRFDVAGSLLAGLGGSALIWAFVGLGQGQAGALEAGLIVAGLAALAAFVWHEGRAESPILPLSFFKHRGYASAMGASFLTFFLGFGLAAYLPIHTAELYPGARNVGIAVASFTIGWSIFAFIAGRLVHRVGERTPTIVGLFLHAAGLVSLVYAFPHGIAWVAPAAFLAGVGMGILSPGLTVTVQNSVDVKRMGSATTSQQFVRQIGAALGVATFTLVARTGGLSAAVMAMMPVVAVSLAFAWFLPRTSLTRSASGPAAEPL